MDIQRQLRRAARAGLFVVGLCGLLANQAAAQPVSRAETLRVIIHADLPAFDPITVASHIGSNYGYMVYDTLFAVDDKQVPQPQMVDSYQISQDGLTYVFTLRDGLAWQDGAAVTSEDVVASLQRWGKKDGLGQLLFANLETLRADSPRQFTLVLKRPFGFVLNALARTSNTGAFIQPARLVKDLPAARAVAETVGSGPYRLEKSEWIPGSKIVFTRNDAYVPRKEPATGLAGGKVAHFKRVEWLLVKDDAAALAALQRGEVDIWENAPPELAEVIAGDKALARTVTNTVGRQLVMRLNHLHPPFDKLPARLAVLADTNQDEYLQAAVGDPASYRTCLAMFLCGTPLQTDVGANLLAHPDAARAKALFAESGWDSAKPIVILQATDFPEFNAAALVLAQNLRKLGLNPQLAPMDWAAVQARRNNRSVPQEGGWNVFFTAGPPGNVGNPMTSPLVLANCDKAFSGWPCDAELEAQRGQFPYTQGAEAQHALAERFQRRAYAQGLYVPLGQFTQALAHRANIHGLLRSSDVEVYWNVRRD